MSWLRVDDGFLEHPKLQALERDRRLWADAMALWLSAGCYCRRAGTGGFISDERLTRLSPLTPRRAREVARALVEDTRLEEDGAGLWLRVEGGFQIHDYAAYGPSEEREEPPRKPPPPAPKEGRAKTAAERAADYRKRKREASEGVTERHERHVTERDAERDERHVTPRAAAHPHARPDPTRPEKEPKGSEPETVTAVTRDERDERDAPRDVTDRVTRDGPRDVTRDAGSLAAGEAIRDRALAALWRGWSDRYAQRLAVPAPSAHREQLRPLATWCVEYLLEHPELTPEVLAERLLGGFWLRTDLKRPKSEWLAEEPARYLDAAAEAELAASRAQRRAQLEQEEREREREADAQAVPPPPEAAGLAAILRGDVQPAPPRKTREERHADRRRELERQAEAVRAQQRTEAGT